jgi:hypothetical protein
MRDRIHDFKELLDAINTPGGHIFICIGLGSFGVTFGLFSIWYAWPDKELATIFGAMTGLMTNFFTVAVYAMQGKDKANGKTIIVTSDTQEHREEVKNVGDKDQPGTSN